MSVCLERAQRARIAWVSPHQGPSPIYRKAFRDAGYVISDLKDERMADLAIVDLRQVDLTASSIRKLTSIARRSAPHGNIVFLSTEMPATAHRTYLRRSGTLVSVKDDLVPLISACREKIRERNLGEEAGERIKTLAHSGALKHLKETTARQHSQQILVAGQPSPTTLNAISVLQRFGYIAEGVLSPSQAMVAIESNQYQCAVFLPSSPSDPLQSLAVKCKRRAFNADLPVILVSNQNISGHDTISNQQVEHDLCPLVRDAITRRRQNKLLRTLLRTDVHDVVKDSHTEAVNATFFARHAARLIARSQETERPMAMVAISLQAQAFNGTATSDIAEPLADIASLITTVTRSEDMLARIAPTTFILTLPATTATDSKKICGRLTGVLQNTMFKMNGQDLGEKLLFAVSAKVNTEAVIADTKLEEIVARLLSGLTPTMFNDNVAQLR